MDVLKNTYHWLERFNRLVKLQLKANLENYTGEIKINFPGELLNIEDFKTNVEQVLDTGKCSDDFIHIINQLYFISAANSDLMVEGNLANSQLHKVCNI